MRDLEDIGPIIEILYHMFNEERDKVLESIDEALEYYNDDPIAQYYSTMQKSTHQITLMIMKH